MIVDGLKPTLLPTTPIPSIISEGSITNPSVGPLNMTIAQSHALCLKEMHGLHIHLTNKLTAQTKCIETISIDMLSLKANIERDFFIP